MRITLVLTEGPASVRMWHGLRLGAALQARGSQLRMFLLDDGVYLGQRGQRPPERMKELCSGDKLEELMETGAQVEACGVCLEHRGIQPDALLEGIRVGTMLDLADQVLADDRTLVF